MPLVPFDGGFLVDFSKIQLSYRRLTSLDCMERPPLQPDLIKRPPSSMPPATSHAHAKQSTLWRWFVHLVQTRPMAFLGGVWVSVFLIAIVAVGSLLSPNAAERRSVSAIAVGSDSAVATQPLDNRGQVPVWLFGAIAITCTAGSILVSRQLNPSPAAAAPVSPPRRKVQQRRLKPLPRPSSPSSLQTVPITVAAMPMGQRAVGKQTTAKKPNLKQAAFKKPPQKTASAKARKPPQKRRTTQRLQPYRPSEAFLETRLPVNPGGFSPQAPSMAQPIPVPIPVSAHPNLPPKLTKSSTQQPLRPKTQRSQTPPPQAAPVPVAVVPAEHSHPLDWGEGRLADAVDLRRKRSLNSWI